MFNQFLSRRSFLTISAMTAASLALDWSKISAYAAQMGPKSDYPTVVIGAGLGGLVCGAYLAKQGVPVTVVEQHSIPGGYATSLDPDRFWRIHRGTIINVNFIDRINRTFAGRLTIKLEDLPETLTVSRSYSHLFKQM